MGDLVEARGARELLDQPGDANEARVEAFIAAFLATWVPPSSAASLDTSSSPLASAATSGPATPHDPGRATPG